MADFDRQNRKYRSMTRAALLWAVLLVFGLLFQPALAAKGQQPDAAEAEDGIPAELSSPEQKQAFLALQEVENLAARYPSLRVFAIFQRAQATKTQNSNSAHTASRATHGLQLQERNAVAAISVEPTLYEAFLWFANFALVSSLGASDLQTLAQSLMQILQSAGNLGQSPEGELGRIFVKDYFQRRADSPYPGQESWLVLRLFLDPPNPADRGARRLSILYNAYQENVAKAIVKRVAPLWQDPEKELMQRSSAYPQKSNSRLSYQYAYLIPKQSSSADNSKTTVQQAPAKAETATKQAAKQTTGPNTTSATTVPQLEVPEDQQTQQAEAKPRKSSALVQYRLSFVQREQLYAEQKLHPQYSTSKYLEILRNYLRDGDSANDSQVPPGVQVLNRRELNAESYFLMQEIILYYYLLYLPERCNYFVSSQQSQWKLNSVSPQLKNLWRVQIPRIWSIIDAVRLRYSRKFDELLPG